MNNISIIYATKTKHSKKLALAIAEALEIKAQNIKENPVLNQVDVLFIASGIYANKAAPNLLKYLNTLDNTLVKSVVLITSSAAGNTPQNDVKNLLARKNIKVLDEFKCYGSFLFFKRKHPNQDDINNAIECSKKIIKK